MNATIALPKVIRAPKPGSLPKGVKMPRPKIASVHIYKIGNGFKVLHQMTHGPKLKPFVFTNPAKMQKHLARIESTEWLQPDRSEGPAIAKTLNLSSGSGSASGW